LKVFEGPFELIDETGLPAHQRTDPQEFAAWVRDKLGSVKPGDSGIIRFRRPPPTAAFSPQDTTHADFERVKDLARAHGFVPVERGTGGRLTMFDENALAITLICPQADPHAHTLRRYEVLSEVLTRAITALGVDARVGELANEYCPGKYSIHGGNGSGARIKLVGLAQRMNRYCVQMGAIIAVERSERACVALADTYAAMGLPFDASTYGGVTQLLPSLTYADVHGVIRQTVLANLMS
jgi:octanoyl-[GcvH]:protein N-octanoyltransferase